MRGTGSLRFVYSSKLVISCFTGQLVSCDHCFSSTPRKGVGTRKRKTVENFSSDILYGLERNKFFLEYII